MRYILRGLLPLIVLFALGLREAVAADRRSEITDSLERRLAVAAGSADSVAVLFNILDLSQGVPARVSAAERVLAAAESAADTTAQLQAIMYLANLRHRDDAALDSLQMRLRALGSDPRVDEISLFVDLLRSELFLRANPTDSASATQNLMLRHIFEAPEDLADRIKLLYALCTRIAESTQGDLLTLYAGELEQLVEHSPLPMGAVRNLIYTRAAITFTNNGKAAEAVATDKKTLNIIDSLAIAYAEQGRRYRRMQQNRYTCYRRMLGNHRVLTPAEVEQYHRAILDLASENKLVAADMESNPRAEASYLMATGHHAEAIPLLRKAINHPANSRLLFHLYSELDSAAIASGNDAVHQEAVGNLYRLSLERLRNSGDERDREIKLLDYVTRLRSAHSEQLEYEKEAARQQHLIVIGIAVLALLMLVGAVIFMYRQNRKSRRLAAELRLAVTHLRNERNDLQATQQELIKARDQAHSADKLKTDFINNMSHEVKTPLAAIAEYSRLIVDCIPDEKRNYLDRFAHTIDLNTRLVLRLVNDVLDIAALENGNMVVDVKPVDVRQVCTLAFDNVFDRSHPHNPDVRLIFDPAGLNGLTVNADPERLVQVLINLLSNAAKFTAKGTITFEAHPSADGQAMLFVVTDTGIGIPEGQEENIFARFKQLDPSVSGCGLGLYISRLLARLQGGSLSVDMSYRKGARFILSLPL